MRLDQFARWGGTTSRNVRALQAARVVPAPSIRGRAGYYGPDHRRRLAAVLALQQSGFTLGAIGTLLAAWENGSTLEEVLGLPPRPREPSQEPFEESDPFAEFSGPRWPSRGPLSLVPTSVTGEIGQVAS